MPGVQEHSTSTDEILREACARNSPVELHYEDPKTRTLTVGRARLLQMAEQSVLTDRPLYTPGSDKLPEQRTISAFFMLGANRYAFKTVIQRSHAPVRLNASQTLRGLELRAPGTVDAIQRRKHFRVGASGLNLDDVVLARPVRGREDCCRVDGRIGPGRIINISTAGAMLLFDTSILKQAKIGARFFGTLKLEGAPQELPMLLEVRHTKRVSSSESFLVGFAFRPWVGADLPKIQGMLTRIVTEFERKLLQRTH